MIVVVNGQKLTLSSSDGIGSGGEAKVFKSTIGGQNLAIKIYHKPDMKRAKKLQAFLSHNWQLPADRIAHPLHLVYDGKGQSIIGLTMPFLGTGFQELAGLSNKKFRAKYLVSNRDVALTFLDGWNTVDQIHSNGAVIGDFNDLNALFRGREMLFIDVDSWQFDGFPCPVGTEQFLVPELYNQDLSVKPAFKPEYDWYSFAVMLFKSLLCVHPYGGTHKQHTQLVTRAVNRISVFADGVTYPTIALSPDLLDDSLGETFEQIFAKGKRGRFPKDVLEMYAKSLIECKQCGSFYPNSRKECPVCHEHTLVVIMRPSTVGKGVAVVEFLRVNGTIIYTRLVGNTLNVIANEKGQLVLYSRTKSGATSRKELFNEIAGVNFELLNDVLVVNLPKSSELILVDISGDKPKAITKSETSIYIGTRRAIYRTSNEHLFRIVGGNLMYGQLHNGMLIERPLRQVMNNHTWFNVRQEATGDKPTVCGFFQVMDKQLFWLVWDGRNYDNLSVSDMEQGESLLDITIKFSSQGVLIRRVTQFQGKSFVRTDMVDDHGNVVFSSPRTNQEDLPLPGLHGRAYTTGKLLHATDEGVMQEEVSTGSIKNFEATKGHVSEGDALYPHQGGLLVVKDRVVTHITLS